MGVVGGKGRGKGGEGREDFAGSPSRDPWEGETWLLDGSYRTGLGRSTVQEGQWVQGKLSSVFAGSAIAHRGPAHVHGPVQRSS